MKLPVLERANVELAVLGPVLGDVPDSQLVWDVGGEHVPGHTVVLVDHSTQVVVDRQPGLSAVLTVFLPERGPPAVV